MSTRAVMTRPLPRPREMTMFWISEMEYTVNPPLGTCCLDTRYICFSWFKYRPDSLRTFMTWLLLFKKL